MYKYGNTYLILTYTFLLILNKILTYLLIRNKMVVVVDSVICQALKYRLLLSC